MSAAQTVADRLKALRVALNRTQAEIAAMAGIPLPTWKKYEAGDREPGAAALAAMAITGVDLHWLITGKGDMWPGNGSYPYLQDLLAQIEKLSPGKKGKYAATVSTKLTAAEPGADNPGINVALLATLIKSIESAEQLGTTPINQAKKVELIASLYLDAQRQLS